MTGIPSTIVSEEVSEKNIIFRGRAQHNQGSGQKSSLTPTDSSIDSHNNISEPPPIVPPPLHLTPENPSQLPTPDISLPPTRNEQIR